MADKIRILQSVNSLGIGGSVIFVMNFFRHIDKSRFQVDFVIYDDAKMDFYKEVIEAGSRVYVCRKRFKNKYLQLLSQMRQVKRLLGREHYDVIHCHSCSFVGIFRGAIPGFLTKGTKVVTHAHGIGMPKDSLEDRIGRMLAKTVLSHITNVGCACSDNAGSSKYTKSFINSNRYVIINNAIESDKYGYDSAERDEMRGSLRINKDTFVVGHVGRLEWEKNHSFLLDIFEKLLVRKPDAVLLLVGDGSLRKSLEEKAGRMGIAEHVIFAGQHRDAADYYQAMDCFVLPSRYEGFPFVLVEAQVNGLRCIVSGNMIKDVNISGGVRFVPLESGAEEWAEKICKFGSRRMMRSEVRKAVSEYDIDNEIRKLEYMYSAQTKGIKMRQQQEFSRQRGRFR